MSLTRLLETNTIMVLMFQFLESRGKLEHTHKKSYYANMQEPVAETANAPNASCNSTVLDDPPSYQDVLSLDRQVDSLVQDESMFGTVEGQVNMDLAKPDVVKLIIRVAVVLAANVANPIKRRSLESIEAAKKMGKVIAAVAMAAADLTNETPTASAYCCAYAVTRAALIAANVRDSGVPPITARTVGNAALQADYLRYCFRVGGNARDLNTKLVKDANACAHDLVMALPKFMGGTVIHVLAIVLVRVAKAVVADPRHRREAAKMFSDYARDTQGIFGHVEPL